jgi:hypothetical protein
MPFRSNDRILTQSAGKGVPILPQGLAAPMLARFDVAMLTRRQPKVFRCAKDDDRAPASERPEIPQRH